MKDLFLDSNAHVPMNNKILSAFIFLNSTLGNHGHPLSPSKPGRFAAKLIENAREKIAQLIGAKSANQIIFTNSCSEACIWGIKILTNISSEKNEICISPLEHPAVYFALDEAITSYQIDPNFSYFDPNNDFFNKTYKPDKAVCIHVQNETGTIEPIEKIPANYLFSDMSQSLGKISVNVTDLNVDIAVFGAHKFGGPSGVGFMYLKDTSNWIEFGNGSRYEMDIPGTPNTLNISLASVALEDAINTLPERQENMKEFQSVLEDGLRNLNCKIICEELPRVFNTTFIQLPKGKDSKELLLNLGNESIHCGLGSACGSLHSDESLLMKKLGEDPNASRYMRISQWGEYNKKDAEVVLDKFLKFL